MSDTVTPLCGQAASRVGLLPPIAHCPCSLCLLRANHDQPPRNACVCRRHENDAGSSEVQVAQLTGRIVHITKHLQRNRKDKASQHGLLCLLSHRKKLLKYMYREDKKAFAKCIRDLGIRNPIQGIRVRGEKASKEMASKKLKR